MSIEQIRNYWKNTTIVSMSTFWRLVRITVAGLLAIALGASAAKLSVYAWEEIKGLGQTEPEATKTV